MTRHRKEKGATSQGWQVGEHLGFFCFIRLPRYPVPLAQDCGELHYSFAKESRGVVSNFVLPEWFSNLLSPTKVKFNRRKGDQK
jgi:hypothetical protein